MLAGLPMPVTSGKVGSLSNGSRCPTSPSGPTGTEEVKVWAGDETICKKMPIIVTSRGCSYAINSPTLPDWT